jgi:preprotein translocase subunit YajC|tara:strand:+ start:1547 stop:1876 length:330 start_codon:yes stop_codon:yes gene_type:complete
MMNFLFPVAYAQTAQGEPNVMSTLLLFGGMFLLMYLLIIRPQSKRAKEHKALVTSITKGDEVLTSGGVLGRVTRVSDDYLAIEVSDGVELKVQKVAIATALPKGTLAKI